jgi:DNA-binding winged helix-turn-helix (wHTH) protein/TolB-like protein/Tfp pilus assembly protein PilF
MKASTKLFYEFGEFCLDPEKHRLLRDGEIVSLTPKAVETLRVLVERPGRLVERDDLINSVWPDVAVEDGNLTVTISMLRKALGEDSNGRKFIETVPRLGYKFVANVREVVQDVPALVVEKQTRSRLVIDEEIRLSGNTSALVSRLLPSSRRQTTILLATAAAVVVAIGAFAYFRHLQSSEINAGATVKSIAVLPLKSFNQNTDDRALSLGFADALMTSLGRVNGVRMISTNSVSGQPDLQKEPLEIGRDLGVDSVLDGTLQRANGKLRVTLRLIRTSDGAQIWSSSFDEAESEIFKLEDAMAAQTAHSLKWNLSGEQRGQIAKRYTENGDAYEAYLRGRLFFDRRNEESYDKAIAEFERAIELDPNYALAYSGLADVYALQANITGGVQRNALYEKARTTARKALELDEELAEAHTSLGWIRRTHDWDWKGAESEFKRAIELNPNYTNAHQWYALLLATLGRLDEAVAEIEKARELEPISMAVLGNYISVCVARRDYDTLATIAQQIARLETDNSIKTRNSSIAYLYQGNYPKVIEVVEDYVAKRGDKLSGNYIMANLAVAYHRTGDKAKAKEALGWLEQQAKGGNETSYRLAMAYSDLGRKDEAVALLQKCLEARDDRMVWIKVEPRFDLLRDDARFQNLVRDMNL